MKFIRRLFFLFLIFLIEVFENVDGIVRIHLADRLGDAPGHGGAGVGAVALGRRAGIGLQGLGHQGAGTTHERLMMKKSVPKDPPEHAGDIRNTEASLSQHFTTRFSGTPENCAFDCIQLVHVHAIGAFPRTGKSGAVAGLAPKGGSCCIC